MNLNRFKRGCAADGLKRVPDSQACRNPVLVLEAHRVKVPPITVLQSSGHFLKETQEMFQNGTNSGWKSHNDESLKVNQLIILTGCDPSHRRGAPPDSIFPLLFLFPWPSDPRGSRLPVSHYLQPARLQSANVFVSFSA